VDNLCTDVSKMSYLNSVSY